MPADADAHERPPRAPPAAGSEGGRREGRARDVDPHGLPHMTGMALVPDLAYRVTSSGRLHSTAHVTAWRHAPKNRSKKKIVSHFAYANIHIDFFSSYTYSFRIAFLRIAFVGKHFFVKAKLRIFGRVDVFGHFAPTMLI